MLRSNLSTLETEGELAVLTLDNGPKNLLSQPEFIDRNTLLDWLAANPGIKGLIITGKGRHFSHGADVSLFKDAADNGISQKLEDARRLLRSIEQLPILTAAAIQGGCFGGGLEIAMSCQFRICAPNVFLGLTEIMHGVVPGMGGMERLYRLLGKEKAISMCLRGEMLNAQDALKLGLVTAVCEEKNPLEPAKAFLRELIGSNTALQIRTVLETLRRAEAGEEDPSKGGFERVLGEANQNP